MKNLNLILVVIILAGVFYLSFTEKSIPTPENDNAAYELLFTEIRSEEIVMYKADGEPTKIEIPKSGLSAKKMLVGDRESEWPERKTKASFFQDRYDEGWQLEFVHDHVGYTFYMFKRKK